MTREQVFEIVKKNIRQILGDVTDDAIRADVSMRELGANSIDRAEVVTQSIEDLGLSVPVRELAGVMNIGGLVDALHAKIA